MVSHTESAPTFPQSIVERLRQQFVAVVCYWYLTISLQQFENEKDLLSKINELIQRIWQKLPDSVNELKITADMNGIAVDLSIHRKSGVTGINLLDPSILSAILDLLQSLVRKKGVVSSADQTHCWASLSASCLEIQGPLSSELLRVFIKHLLV